MASPGSSPKGHPVKENPTMKKQVPAPREGRLFRRTLEKTMNRNPKMVWMVDLKKAGDRAGFLWSKNQKKGLF
jgi:hypothetical protein